MASLVPFTAKDISVQYLGLTRTLHLKAEGQIPACFLAPFFNQESWLGGLRFSIKAFSRGFGKLPPTQNVKIEKEVFILLPIPYFNNKTVLIETACGTYDIKIEYIEWPEPFNDEEPTGMVTNDAVASSSGPDKKDKRSITVLPPKELLLTDKGTADITAQIPKDLVYNVDFEFNAEFIKIVHSSVDSGWIKWAIKWANPPPEEDNPQLVNVVTTIEHDVTIAIMPPVPKISQAIQPYIIYRVWLMSDK